MSFPITWTTTSLSEVCTKIVDGSHNPPKAVENGFPMLSAKNIYKRKVFFDDYRLISKEDFEIENNRTNISSGDVLLTIVGAIGRGAVVNEGLDKFTLQRSVAVLKPFQINPKYLSYALEAPKLQKYLQDNAKGTAQKGIYLKALSAVTIPLAPLNEQRRIADKLDTTLARVDTLNDRLARITPLLKRFRQSVLAAATSGRLTEDWVLQYSLPEAHQCTLKEVIKVSSGDGLTAKNMNSDGGIPVFGGNGINGYHDQHNVNESTIVIGRVGYYCGSVHLTPEKAWVTDNALKVAYDKQYINKKFLYYSLLGNDLRKNVSSTAQPVISGQKIYSLPFRLPVIEEQTEIVRRVETLFAFADRLEARLQSAQTAVERLTPALLAKAFRGELVPQDPSDEPAAELLRRLREARAADTASKPKRGRAAKAPTVSE